MKTSFHFKKYLPVAGAALLALALLAALSLCCWQQGRLTALQGQNEALARQVEALSPTPAPPEPSVEEVTFLVSRGPADAQVPATVTVPASGGSMPLVVLCHGFTGDRQGDGHFAPLARMLAQAGIAVIAVDFPGNGDSAEPFTEYTLDNMYADIEGAIDYMARRYDIDTARIGLLGHSMGGRAVTLHLSGRIAAAALWSPANGAGLNGLEFLDHDPAALEALRQQAAADGSVELHDWAASVSTEFIEQMANSLPAEKLRSYQGALLIAFAAGDTGLLSQQTIDETLQAACSRQKSFTDLYGEFLDATHNYTALSGNGADDAEIRARLETATADFFIQALAG